MLVVETGVLRQPGHHTGHHTDIILHDICVMDSNRKSKATRTQKFTLNDGIIHNFITLIHYGVEG